MKIFSERIVLERNKAGKTQQQVAEYLGIIQQTYSEYERNVSEPDLQKLILLADYFDVSTDYLLGRADI